MTADCLEGWCRHHRPTRHGDRGNDPGAGGRARRPRAGAGPGGRSCRLPGSGAPLRPVVAVTAQADLGHVVDRPRTPAASWATISAGTARDLGARGTSRANGAPRANDPTITLPTPYRVASSVPTNSPTLPTASRAPMAPPPQLQRGDHEQDQDRSHHRATKVRHRRTGGDRAQQRVGGHEAQGVGDVGPSPWDTTVTVTNCSTERI